ncbi:hypothetical protein [Desulfovibrio gilichinskyi]|uniref:hypothetical protein n=1 Tax=Desulfovibrio gilichinskyi TaxID=1519643 RepID=UPI000A164212|nr:hypothetical protein [Desulfovibrio gilichinskyi]
MTQNKKNDKAPSDDKSSNKPICGLIMPISGMPDCPQHHWKNEQTILKSSITMSGFESRLVSDADER